MQIRPLLESDDRTRFESGDPDLDRFFWRFAGQNQFQHQIGSTYVAVDAGRILGFVTVAPASMEFDDLPVAVRKGFPRYPLPILRLARLAVDRRAQGAGIGGALLRLVFDLALRLGTDFGCVGVMVDAKPDALGFYEKYGFIQTEVVEGGSESRPRPIPLFLSTRRIRSARGT